MRWTENDVQVLESEYSNKTPVSEIALILNNKFSESAIMTKANKLGLVSREKWTDEDINKLIEYYQTYSVSQIAELMPNRTINGISSMAQKLGLSSKSVWKESERLYIKENWFLEPDLVMAQKLNRSPRSVKWQREQLGLLRRDRDSKHYESLSKFLRANNSNWKNESMKTCEYKCVLTGSKDFQIHHLYSVSAILDDMVNDYQICIKPSFLDYSEDELTELLTLFLKIQAQYPLGECVRKDIHTLFHSLYGQYYNTPEQWYKFKKEYEDGLYMNIPYNYLNP